MGFITDMFTPDVPDMPAPPPAPPPPVRADAEVAAESAGDQLRKRRGRASTVLTEDGNGSLDGSSSSKPTTAAARILGT